MIVLGQKQIEDMQLGDKPLTAIYMGENLVWEAGIDIDTQAVIDRATALAYALPTDIKPLDRLIKNLKYSTIWDYLDCFYIFAGDGSQGFKCLNIRNPNNYECKLYGGITFQNNGIKGGGVNGYLSTNLDLSTGIHKYQTNDAILSGVLSEYSTNGRNDILGYDNSTTLNAGTQLVAVTSAALRINSLNSYQFDSAVDLTGTGYKSIKRISSNNIRLYNKNVLHDRIIPSSTIRPTPLLIGRTYGGYTSSCISCVFAGQSFSNELEQEFRTIFNNYLTSIGQTAVA